MGRKNDKISERKGLKRYEKIHTFDSVDSGVMADTDCKLSFIKKIRANARAGGI